MKLEGAPDPSDVKDARKSDPDDETKLRWIFGVGNGGREKRKVTIRVVVFDRDGKVITKDERSDSVSGETADDHISVWTKIRTRAWPRADHIGVSVRCSKD